MAKTGLFTTKPMHSIDTYTTLFFKNINNNIIIYFNRKLAFTQWQWYYNTTEHTNKTSQKITHTLKQNTAH
jgi:hypothetical protein